MAHKPLLDRVVIVQEIALRMSVLDKKHGQRQNPDKPGQPRFHWE
jgi:hypothetical protein